MSESPIVISSDSTPVGSPLNEVVIDLSAKEEFPPSRPTSPAAGCSHWPTRSEEKEDHSRCFSSMALTYEEEDASSAPDYDESELDPEDLTNAPKRPKKDGKRLRNMLIKIAEQQLLAMVLHFKEELETWKINPTELREIPTVIKFSLITHPRCLQTWFARLMNTLQSKLKNVQLQRYIGVDCLIPGTPYPILRFRLGNSQFGRAVEVILLHKFGEATLNLPKRYTEVIDEDDIREYKGDLSIIYNGTCGRAYDFSYEARGEGPPPELQEMINPKRIIV
ncbi:hypothetical protein GE061_007745 [Apolygus lucorum]|uniref:Uncharacterized protein n=1 Tax=Apolygus lucorum TaxID=248454 RepID=A0A8S9WLI4_APOLU|nr:hypothetical protein GE061_007745 [Apolygus lucorum]